MTSTFNIPPTLLPLGRSIFGPFTAPAGTNIADLTLSRVTTGGSGSNLDSLTSAVTVTVSLAANTVDNVITSDVVPGGHIVNKGVVLTANELQFGLGGPLDGIPVFGIVDVAGSAVLTSGSLTIE